MFTVITAICIEHEADNMVHVNSSIKRGKPMDAVEPKNKVTVTDVRVDYLPAIFFLM